MEIVLRTVWLPEKDTFTFKIKVEPAKETAPLGDPWLVHPSEDGKTSDPERASRDL